MAESGSYILVLTTVNQDKQVPVLIGEAEAQAIIMAVENRKAKRPLTHNLLCNIMENYMLTLKHVTIDRFEEGIFYSTLHISDGFNESHIDSRTSDAVVLAIMQQADITMAQSVLDETCMVPGALIDNLPQNRHSSRQAESIEALEALLQECEANEDYERAQEIMNQINALKKE